MNTDQINDKIADFIKAAEKRNWVNYELQGEKSLSLAYPGGEIAYFKQKIFDLKQQISDSSMIGNTWVINGCSYDIIEAGWIQKFIPIAINHMEETAVWNQLQIFLRQYFQLSNYENIVRENESIVLMKSLEPKEYGSLTRARAFCIIEILKRPEHNETKFSKKRIIELVKKEFPAQSGKTVYDERGIITNNIEEARNRHKLDYEYGLKLYKEKYPD